MDNQIDRQKSSRTVNKTNDFPNILFHSHSKQPKTERIKKIKINNVQISTIDGSKSKNYFTTKYFYVSTFWNKQNSLALEKKKLLWKIHNTNTKSELPIAPFNPLNQNFVYKKNNPRSHKTFSKTVNKINPNINLKKKEKEQKSIKDIFSNLIKLKKQIKKISIENKVNTEMKFFRPKTKVFQHLSPKSEKKENTSAFSRKIQISQIKKNENEKYYNSRIFNNSSNSGQKNMSKKLTLKFDNSTKKYNYHNNEEKIEKIKCYSSENNHNKSTDYISKIITSKKVINDHIKYIQKIKENELVDLLYSYKRALSQDKKLEDTHFKSFVYPIELILYLIQQKKELTIGKFKNEYIKKRDRFKTSNIMKILNQRLNKTILKPANKSINNNENNNKVNTE